MITNGFAYIAAVAAIPAVVCWLEAKTTWKIWKWLPAFVFVYLLNMIFCTFNLWDLEATSSAYSAVKGNLQYAMIPLLLLRCDIRKLAKLGKKLIITMCVAVLTMCVGITVSYAIFSGVLGNASDGAAAALMGSWLGGSDTMVVVQAALGVSEGDMGAAIIIDNIYYSLWIAFLLWAACLKDKFNKITKADTSFIDSLETMDADSIITKTEAPSFASLIFLLGFGLVVSAVGQYVGSLMNGLLTLDDSTWCVLFCTAVGICLGMTKMSKIGGASELGNILCYIVVSMLASRAGFNELFDAPMWLIFGAVALGLHVLLTFFLARIFHLDLYSCGVASMACVGGTGSAPIIASSYNGALIPAGILMGIAGGIVGNILPLFFYRAMHLFA